MRCTQASRASCNRLHALVGSRERRWIATRCTANGGQRGPLSHANERLPVTARRPGDERAAVQRVLSGQHAASGTLRARSGCAARDSAQLCIRQGRRRPRRVHRDRDWEACGQTAASMSLSEAKESRRTHKGVIGKACRSSGSQTAGVGSHRRNAGHLRSRTARSFAERWVSTLASQGCAW